MTLHTIEPERRTLHGAFDRDREPLLTIAPGDTVRFRTLDAGWGLDGPDLPRPKFEPRDPERDNGHALCGPVAVRGAQPGMTLAVKIGAIRVGTWGWNVAGGWSSPVNDALGVTDTEIRLNWRLDPEKLLGRDQFGHEVTLRPFLGVMGMPANVDGLQSTTPPRPTGGNMDCKELVPGSTLYLPIAVTGGLFSCGDGHAVQGDGEISCTAIECPMEYADLTFDLLPDLHLERPRAHTPAGWLTFGFDRNLNVAMHQAVGDMLALMQTEYGLDKPTALALASLVVDVRVTQVVNDLCGVHAVLPHNALRFPAPHPND